MRNKVDLDLEENALWDERTEDENNPILKAKCDAIGFLLGKLDPITDEEIAVPQSNEDLDKLIAILKKEKEAIAEYSLFGDPHWRMFDAQIEICEWAKGT